jgi:hypothetical protein
VFGNNIFLLSLCDSNGVAVPITKVVNSNRGKLEIMATDCGDNNMWRCHNSGLQCRRL